MNIDSDEVHQNLNNENVLFLDVRRPDEVANGILNAQYFVHIPHTNVEEKFALDDAQFQVTDFS